MNVLRTLAVGCLLTFGAALVLEGFSSSAAAEDKEEKKSARVFLKKVKVSETNKDDKSWDINDGKPDIVVRLRNMSDDTTKEFTSAEKADTFEATYDVATVPVSAGHKLQITVEDKDVAANDTIGQTTVEITAAMLKKGSAELTFGQVKSLTLEFKAP